MSSRTPAAGGYPDADELLRKYRSITAFARSKIFGENFENIVSNAVISPGGV
jgi:hypothetical protein